MESFTVIPHDGLMSAVSERICDREVLALLRAFLRAGVMENGAVRREVTGTPQGGVISPLVCNVYLTRLDRKWRPAYGTLVRYADDLVAVCKSRGQANVALAKLTELLGGLGLEQHLKQLHAIARGANKTVGKHASTTNFAVGKH